MKIVIQRVTSASVSINHIVVSSIGKGAAVLIGFHQNDTKETARWMAKKLIYLRYFQDHKGKTNLSLQDVQGELLVISQFTLYASCEEGRRPSLIHAASPVIAKPLYDFFIQELTHELKNVKTGVFGADMALSLVNDGPFTLIIER
ncbi:MAG: D-aminoacyl-tRNA deacylase [Candidatus Rhabdochlamydia sp.]